MNIEEFVYSLGYRVTNVYNDYNKGLNRSQIADKYSIPVSRIYYIRDQYDRL